ncbi:unnamed protein product [Urochloa humidicola]
MSSLSAGSVAVDCKVQKGNAGTRAYASVAGPCRHECNCATSIFAAIACERVMCSVVDVVQKLKKQSELQNAKNCMIAVRKDAGTFLPPCLCCYACRTDVVADDEFCNGHSNGFDSHG